MKHIVFVIFVIGLALFFGVGYLIQKASADGFEINRSAHIENILSCEALACIDTLEQKRAKARFLGQELTIRYFAVGDLDYQSVCMENALGDPESVLALPIVEALGSAGRNNRIGELQLLEVPANTFSGGQVSRKIALHLKKRVDDIIGDSEEEFNRADIAERVVTENHGPNYIFGVYDARNCRLLEYATAFGAKQFDVPFELEGYTGFFTTQEGHPNAYMARLPDKAGFGVLRNRVIIYVPIRNPELPILETTFTGNVVEVEPDVFELEIRERGLIEILGIKEMPPIHPLGSEPR